MQARRLRFPGRRDSNQSLKPRNLLVLVAFQRDLFFFSIGAIAEHQSVEVHKVSIKFGAVYASEPGLAVHYDAASPAHARTVDHHRIEADIGLDVVRFCQLGYGAHHRQRADRVYNVDIPAIQNQFVQRLYNQSFSFVTAIVGDNVQLVARLSHFFFKDQQTLVAGADDRNHLVSSGLCRSGDRQDLGDADSSADAHNRAEAFHGSRMAQRTNHIGQLIARAKRVQQTSAFADALDDQRDASAIQV